MTIRMFRGDELPAWVATISLNGSTSTDLSTGYTFSVAVKQGSATPVLTKTTNITGAAGSVVTVAWASQELDLAPGTYRLVLTVTRTSDSAEFTVEDRLEILGA